MPSTLVKIEPDFLKSIHNGHYHTPDVYFHNNRAVRWLFWERFNQITKMIESTSSLKRGICLDFGGGSGIFLPTLSKLFEKVILVDLEPSQALIIKEKFKLYNCEVVQKNIFDCKFNNIDCIIAADVLEHFEDTKAIVNKLKDFMSKETYLFTSLPSENWLYNFMRFIFKEEKPIDHYYGSKEIEIAIKSLNLDLLQRKKLMNRPFDLFSVSMWKITGEEYEI